MSEITRAYLQLAATEDTEITGLYHSDTHYVRAAIEAQGLNAPPLDQIDKLLYEEGLKPWSAYGVPSWFARKYAPKRRSRKTSPQVWSRAQSRNASQGNASAL